MAIKQITIDEESFPVKSIDLIEMLDKTYPARCSKKGESEIEAHRYAARRELIDELLVAKQEYEEGTNEDT